MLKELEKPIADIKSDMVHQLFFKEFEVGKINAQEFREFIKEFTSKKISDIEIDKAWNEMLGDLPVKRLHVLNKLKQHYQLILFSNTNEIHLKEFRNICSQFNVSNFDSYFGKAYYSHLVGMRKPNVETYQWICKQHGFSPADILFFDDSEVNLKGAESIGIQTFLVNDADELFQELDKQV